MSEFAFVFAVHNHQPVGNFDWVLERAFEDCYRPFLEAVERRPGFRFCLHFTGPLWEHMEKKDKGCLDLIRRLVDRGQVELLGGGFYEPVLPVIPEADRVGQLRLMNAYLEEKFGRKPRGLWLAERVWEPQLARTLREEGLEFTFLDESHLNYGGVTDIHRTYVTEEDGFPLRIFPISKKLRYLIPFQPLDKVEQAFRDIEAGGGAAILGDDGEKFGLWPGTKKWVYDEGWLEGFLEFIERRGIRTMTASEYLDAEPPAGRVYIPPCSYEEMMEWVLEPEGLAEFRRLKEGTSEAGRRFLRGGMFRDYFLKYPEASNLRSRMLLVSSELRSAATSPAEARRDLYRGQCNDAYWHGVFGGLYLPHLREAAYTNLIRAENKVRTPRAGWAEADLDADGSGEAYSLGPTFNVFVRPAAGGSVYEIDHTISARNLLNVLSRRPESYHTRENGSGGKGKSIHELERKFPEGAETLLSYDPMPRYSALDRFLLKEPFPGFVRGGKLEDRGDLTGRAYDFSIKGERLFLRGEGRIRLEGAEAPVAVTKTIENGPGRIRLSWLIENQGDALLRAVFSPEWNFLAFPGELVLEESGRASLCGGRIVVLAPGAAGMSAEPIETLSQSEEGFDIIHQGFRLCPFWRLDLAGAANQTMELVIEQQD
jgi:hypothetical protein